jgi:L-histidine N-alpha-methyltransferase
MSTPLQLQHSSPIAADVHEGLTSKPKWLSPKLFYDAEGSALFEQITELPEYYLTRTERSILLEKADEIAKAAGKRLSLIELGAGTASKTRILIAAALRRQKEVSFYPIDVSRSALDEAVASLNGDFPGLRVSPVVADYSHGLGQLTKTPGRKLLLYLGSSIGNFEPMEAGRMLHMMRSSLNRGDALLLGTDMVKPPEILIPAYDDALGITAEFNRNILRHINRELDADFDPATFKHLAFWNKSFSRMEMHLVSTRPQVINIRALQMCVNFTKGERIHTENSYKFTQPVVDSILNLAGFTRESTWTDPQGWFALHLARVQ